MLSPKRTKYRKAHKGRIHGLAKGGTQLDFGAFRRRSVFAPGRATCVRHIVLGPGLRQVSRIDQPRDERFLLLALEVVGDLGRAQFRAPRSQGLV